MRISDLIKELLKCKKEHGDLRVASGYKSGEIAGTPVLESVDYTRDSAAVYCKFSDFNELESLVILLIK